MISCNGEGHGCLAVTAKCAPLAEFVTLTLVSGDMPLKVEFDLEPGVVTYFVAPKCGSDDGDDEGAEE